MLERAVRTLARILIVSQTLTRMDDAVARASSSPNVVPIADVLLHWPFLWS
jgi:hypothetical protein